MFDNAQTVQHLSSVISQIAAPAFLLSAEAELLAVLIARKDRVIDRARAVGNGHASAPSSSAQVEIPWLKQRARLLHRSIYCSTASAMLTALLIIIAFASAFIGFQHEYGAGTLFVLALGLFFLSLGNFAYEVHISNSEVDF